LKKTNQEHTSLPIHGVIVLLAVGDENVVITSFDDAGHKETLFFILTLVAEKKQKRL